MSDLTITNAGVTVATGAPSVKSNNQKLTQMTMRVVNVQPLNTTGAHEANDLLFNSTKIPNAVSVAGGSGIIQSVTAISATGNVGAIDIYFIQESSLGTAPDMGTLKDFVASSSDCSDADMKLQLGTANIGNFEDMGGASVGYASNVGVMIQAIEGSRDVYVWGITRSTDNPGSGQDFTIRLGIIQD
tara:strand:+ start:1022 stop:1582 length:561 start_codon:yes stop_codon:yes gene_type:complete